MQYVQLGRTGVRVSRICLGTAFRARLDEQTCGRVIGRALELGCNFIDCANSYGPGRSEEIVGRAIRGKRDDLFVATKVCSAIGPGPNDHGLSRYHVLREVERSLTRLGTDRIDLYYLHIFDPQTPREETLRAMEDAVRQGKVRYLGASNYPAWEVADLVWTARARGWDPICCLQDQYNLLHRRHVETQIVPVCEAYNLTMVTYSALAVGLLTGHHRRGQAPPAGSAWTPDRLEQALSPQGDAVVAEVVAIARERGCTPSQVALAWLLGRPCLTAPIIGPDLPEQVDEAFAALEVALESSEQVRLDAVSRWSDPPEYL
ncbi:MAG: aldo/keto reductase [Candidatus Latescibacterota bacterium]|jgi:aryl-alcohol dehydrogenase-like predicted oxidoreductase